MRSVFLCLFLIVGLAACDTEADLSPGEAYDQALAAMMDRDASEAMKLLRTAAAQGHLEATAMLADTYARGQLAPRAVEPNIQRSEGAIILPIRVLPGQARRWRRRFDALIEDRLDAEDPDAMLLQAGRLFDQDRRSPTPDNYAQAISLLTTAADRGNASAALQLAVKMRHTEPEASERWITLAFELGHPQACMMRVTLLTDEDDILESARDLEDYMARMGACKAEATIAGVALTYVVDVYSTAKQDDADAQATLDSLETTGVLGQFPELARGFR
ncbi:MAG: sel1 repeat family protein [Bacteroidetes bacterium]|nr:sel1 repeat family protein [Bacteroidota bacterium]